MKNFNLFLFCFLFSVSAFGQKRDSVTVVEPQQFPVETNLPGDVAFYTRESNTNRKVNLDDIFDAVIATDGGTVSFTPTPTGNGTQYRNQFVTTASGDVYFIDVNGKSIQFASGDVNDADADPLNEIQTLSKSNSTVFLSNGGGSFVDETADGDADATNEIQNLMLVDETLVLSGGGGSINIGVIDNDEQTLSIANDELSISNGNNVDLEPYSVDNQTLMFNNSTGELTISGSGGGNSVSIPAGNGGDNWGSQVAVTDATMNGDGTSANPLGVTISTDSDNSISTGSDGGIYATTSSGGSSDITYTIGDANVTATGTGVTYVQNGNTATIEIPIGVKLKYVSINETKDFSSNDYVVRIIDRNGTANAGINTFMPVLWDFIKRDNLNAEPPTSTLAFDYTDDNPPTSTKKITGYGAAPSGVGTFIDTTFVGVDSYGQFTVAGFVGF